MNIGFDAKRAFFNRTGLGNYSRSLIEALHQYYPNNHYQLYTPKFKEEHLFSLIKGNTAFEIVKPNAFWMPSLWRSIGIPQSISRHKTEVYHGLSAELPMGNKPKGTKYVVSIHDLIFVRYPELYKKVDRNIYLKKTLYACQKADHIMAISEQTKRDLIQFLNIDAEKITVVYQDCDPLFSKNVLASKKESVALKYQLPQRFILSVGTLEFRKNALVILKALLHLPADVHLVLVGKPTDYLNTLTQFVEVNGLAERVHFIHGLPFEDLPSIYQLAEVFVYPSIFEGFGIPIIEALKSAKPVIAATGSCLEEAGGPDSLYFTPDDDHALAKHILNLWNDAALRASQVERGLTFVQKFSPKQFAEDTMNLYLSLF